MSIHLSVHLNLDACLKLCRLAKGHGTLQPPSIIVGSLPIGRLHKVGIGNSMGMGNPHRSQVWVTHMGHRYRYRRVRVRVTHHVPMTCLIPIPYRSVYRFWHSSECRQSFIYLNTYYVSNLIYILLRGGVTPQKRGELVEAGCYI